MSDRELLEMAAKAANQERSSAGDLWSNARCAPWNPLTDDGDALRLAVKLGFSVHSLRHLELTQVHGSSKWVGQVWKEAASPESATRRAIVRAAAEIGKAMP